MKILVPITPKHMHTTAIDILEKMINEHRIFEGGHEADAYNEGYARGRSEGYYSALEDVRDTLKALPKSDEQPSGGWIVDISEIKKAIAYIDTGIIQIDRILHDGIKENGIILEDAGMIKGNIISRLGIINRWLNRLERLVGAAPLPTPPTQLPQ